MRLPARSLLRTGEVDYAAWNYRALLGAIVRARYKLVVALLGTRRFRRILEVGYGSGVFMPELHRRCDELYGVDVHHRPDAVATTLAAHGVRAVLSAASATRLPFPDGFADCVVAVSALEFIDDLDAACAEIARVLTPDGVFIVVTPGRSAIADSGLRLLTGKRARADFGDRRERVLPTLRTRFAVERQLTVPRFGGPALRLYTALRLRPRCEH
jgi:SAM-dependent methyltransferase